MSIYISKNYVVRFFVGKFKFILIVLVDYQIKRGVIFTIIITEGVAL
jgi:hypothetical protein